MKEILLKIYEKDLLLIFPGIFIFSVLVLPLYYQLKLQMYYQLKLQIMEFRHGILYTGPIGKHVKAHYKGKCLPKPDLEYQKPDLELRGKHFKVSLDEFENCFRLSIWSKDGMTHRQTSYHPSKEECQVEYDYFLFLIRSSRPFTGAHN